MENIEQEQGKDEWKGVLRSQIISAITGTQAEQMHAYKEIGYYYMCCAPASLYKCFPDEKDRLNSVRNICYGIPLQSLLTTYLTAIFLLMRQPFLIKH